jgi:hypothetical protein
MGFAERRAEGIWARRFGRQSIQRAGRHGLHFFAPQNAATESSNAGIEIVLGERFPSVTVFGLSLARGGHQTMKRSISIYH